MFRKKLRIAALFGLGLFALASCSSYQRALKSDDITLKYKTAEYYYNKGDYPRALPFLEQLVSLYRGTAQIEELSYREAYAYYKSGQYHMGAFLFKGYTETFPLSNHAEDACYFYADCLYQESPIVDLDQSSTKKAIDAYQLFLNKYPSSNHVEESNKRIDEMGDKLELKQWQTAMLYYKIRDYKSAVWAIKSFLSTYPASSRKEEGGYYVIKASYLLADNSIDQKKEERFLNTLQYFSDFKEKFPTSKYMKELEAISKDSNSQINKHKI